MTRIGKRISFILIIMVGLAAMPMQSFASTNSILDTGFVNLEDGYKLEYIEYGNGNVKFDLVKEQETIASSYLDKSNEIIRSENLLSGSVRTYSIDYEASELRKALANNQETELYATSGYTTAGTITYNLHRVREGVAYDTTGKLTMQYKETTSKTIYNINHTVQDITALAALLVAGMALVPSVAAVVSAAIFNKLGFVSNAVNVLIKDYNVIAKKTTVTWKEQNLSSTFSGDAYDVTYDDGSTGTIYEGDYFAKTSIKEKNTKFALKAAAKYFPTFTATVTGW